MCRLFLTPLLKNMLSSQYNPELSLKTLFKLGSQNFKVLWTCLSGRMCELHSQNTCNQRIWHIIASCIKGFYFILNIRELTVDPRERTKRSKRASNSKDFGTFCQRKASNNSSIYRTSDHEHSSKKLQFNTFSKQTRFLATNWNCSSSFNPYLSWVQKRNYVLPKYVCATLFEKRVLNFSW